MAEKKIDRFIYKESERIGSGSFGEVFRGRDETTGEIVAIKIVKKKLIMQDKYLEEGLKSEMSIMKKLKSPNIVRYVDIAETHNNFYIFQEYCDSGDLAGLLKKRKSIPEKEALKLITDVLRGYQELVKNGVIHRDLKPANILIHQGNYKLADFGFAKCVENFKQDMLESSVGTPLYMSPQILNSDPYTAKTDVWSMAFILYESIFTKTPWTGKSIPELYKNINMSKLTFDSSFNVSDGLKDFLTSCLKVKEVERLSWDQIYRHPLFNQEFTDYINKQNQLETQAVYIINDIRQEVIFNKIDIEELFRELDESKDQVLQFSEFKQLFEKINKKLDREQVEFIFNLIDEDHSGTIELSEFLKWLKQNNVRMNQTSAHKLQKQNTITNKNPNSNNFSRSQSMNQEPQKGQPPIQQSQGQNYQNMYGGMQPSQGYVPQVAPQNFVNYGYQQQQQQYGMNPQPQMPIGQNIQFSEFGMGGLAQKYQHQLSQGGVQKQQAYQQQHSLGPTQSLSQQVDPMMKLLTAINRYSIKLDELFNKYCDNKQKLDLVGFALMMRQGL